MQYFLCRVGYASSAFVCCLFVCQQDYAKAKVTQLIFAKFGGKVAHGKKRLDFGGDPDSDPRIF